MKIKKLLYVQLFCLFIFIFSAAHAHVFYRDDKNLIGSGNLVGQFPNNSTRDNNSKKNISLRDQLVSLTITKSDADRIVLLYKNAEKKNTQGNMSPFISDMLNSGFDQMQILHSCDILCKSNSGGKLLNILSKKYHKIEDNKTSISRHDLQVDRIQTLVIYRSLLYRLDKSSREGKNYEDIKFILLKIRRLKELRREDSNKDKTSALGTN